MKSRTWYRPEIHLSRLQASGDEKQLHLQELSNQRTRKVISKDIITPVIMLYYITLRHYSITPYYTNYITYYTITLHHYTILHHHITSLHHITQSLHTKLQNYTHYITIFIILLHISHHPVT